MYHTRDSLECASSPSNIGSPQRHCTFSTFVLDEHFDAKRAFNVEFGGQFLDHVFRRNRGIDAPLPCFELFWHMCTTCPLPALSYIPSYARISHFLVCKVVDIQSACVFKNRIYL